MKPDFFIIGVQKGGTTSLYNYLAQHPCVLASTKKEIHYFSDNYSKGKSWYKNHFASFFKQIQTFFTCKDKVITGEATPYYIFHPHAPTRIKKDFPNAKIIMMLRNPIDRAYSHYRFHIKLGEETLTFEEAITAEPERLQAECEKMFADEHYNSTNYKTYSYLKRGVYADQVARWFALFPKEQILTIKSEDFFSDPETSYCQVQKFLGLPDRPLSAYKKFNVGRDSSMNPETRAGLVKYYEPHNKRLYDLLGKKMNWD